MIQRGLDNFVKWIHLTSMSFNMSKCTSQAYLEIRNADHTSGMRKCVFEMGTLKLNPLKRDLKAKPQQGVTITLVEVGSESQNRRKYPKKGSFKESECLLHKYFPS